MGVAFRCVAFRVDRGVWDLGNFDGWGSSGVALGWDGRKWRAIKERCIGGTDPGKSQNSCSVVESNCIPLFLCPLP